MMREILFRGKQNNALSEDKFIYGLIVKQVDLDGKDEFCIQTWERDTEGVSSRVLGVIPSTISEFSGLYDKNGTKIFEGDVVKVDTEIYKVAFLKGCWVILKNDGWDFLETNSKSCAVVGNIYDNPELTKGK